MKEININDYVSFWNNDHVLYKVLDIQKNYILIKDENDLTYWKRKDYIHRVIHGINTES